MSLHRRHALFAPLAVLLPAGLAPGEAAAQTTAAVLNIGIGGAVTSVDPHFFNAAPNNSLSMHLFERLVERDATAQLVPGLAVSWSVVAPTIWEFRLRPNVTWHDGKPFTADDVAFTVTRAPNVPGSPGGFGGFLRAITRTEVVDPLTIRFHTARPHPLLPTELGSVAIISRHAGEGAGTEDYNSGRAAIGTGPYRLVAYRPGDRAELERYDGHWGEREPWARVNYRFIASDPARTAALLAGDVDVIDQVASSDLPRLRRDPRVAVQEIQGLRVIYLMSDFSRPGASPFVTDNDGKPLEQNPFLDLRVRRALSIAINRQGLCDQVMEGTAAPNGQWLPPGLATYNPAVPVPAHDPDGARQLLAEAGFPQGFRVTLHSPNDRYPNDARTAQAVAQMWTRVGIRTQVEALPWASFSVRSNRQEFAIRLAGWGSGTGEASYTLVNILGSYDAQARTGASNSGRYSNPALDAMTAAAVAELDDARREAMLRDAVKAAMDDVAMIPLFQLVNIWATRRSITYGARMDERTTAMAVRPVTS